MERNERHKKWAKESTERYLLRKEMWGRYRHFIGTSSRLHDRMKKNLSQMSCNKGYIHRGIWFFGRKPCKEEYPVVMFERMPNNILYIHEYNKYSYKLSEKNYKTRRTKTLFRKKRVPKKGYYTDLSDYVSK